MIKFNPKEQINFTLIIDDAHPDLIEPVTAYRHHQEGEEPLKLNRKQFGECVRWAYSVGAAELPSHVILVRGGAVCEWRTYSKVYDGLPNFIQILEKVKEDGQFRILGKPGLIARDGRNTSHDWNYKMIRHGGFIGKDIVITHHVATNDYSVRAIAPSIYKLVEQLPVQSVVYYSGRLRDEQIDSQRTALREVKPGFKRDYVKH